MEHHSPLAFCQTLFGFGQWGFLGLRENDSPHVYGFEASSLRIIRPELPYNEGISGGDGPHRDHGGVRAKLAVGIEGPCPTTA